MTGATLINIQNKDSFLTGYTIISARGDNNRNDVVKQIFLHLIYAVF